MDGVRAATWTTKEQPSRWMWSASAIGRLCYPSFLLHRREDCESRDFLLVVFKNLSDEVRIRNKNAARVSVILSVILSVIYRGW